MQLLSLGMQVFGQFSSGCTELVGWMNHLPYHFPPGPYQLAVIAYHQLDQQLALAQMHSLPASH